MSEGANHQNRTFEQALERYKSQLFDITTIRQARPEFAGVDVKSQIEALDKFLSDKTTWRTAPASTKYHLCVPGGLLIHSVEVAETACKVAKAIMPTLSMDSVLLCGLYHDLGKVWGNVGPDGALTPRYEQNMLKSGKASDAAPYKYLDGGSQMSVATRSVRLVEKFVDLMESEAQAIHGHDGQYIRDNHAYQHNEHPLLLITHFADMWTGHVTEGDIKVEWLSGVFSGR